MKNSPACQGKDVYERINYLYQASQLVLSKNTALASYYNSILMGCARKSVLRLDHNLKRSICKACQCPLIPGQTAKVRLLGKKKKRMRTTCQICNKAKNIPTKGEQNLWPEQPEALIETIDYKPRPNKVDINTVNVTNDGDSTTTKSEKKIDDNLSKSSNTN